MNSATLISATTAFKTARVIHAAVELGVFEQLADRGRDAEELARDLACSVRGIRRLADALVAIGLLEGTAARYDLAPVARTHLVEKATDSYTALVRWQSVAYESFGSLAASVRSGEPLDVDARFADRPDARLTWLRALDQHARAGGHARRLAEAIRVPARSRLLDIGGGLGTYAIAFCRRHADLTVTLFDVPATAALATAHIEASGQGSRTQVVGGDYLEDELPGPADIVLLSNVLHQHDPDTARTLVARAFDGTAPGGTLVVHGLHLADARTGPLDGALLSLTLLLHAPNENHTARAIAAWMAEAGYVGIEEKSLEARSPGELMVALKPRTSLRRTDEAARRMAPAD